MSEPEGPFIVWVDFGCEGWQPYSYKTLKEALSENRFGNFVITKLVNWNVVEVEE